MNIQLAYFDFEHGFISSARHYAPYQSSNLHYENYPANQQQAHQVNEVISRFIYII